LSLLGYYSCFSVTSVGVGGSADTALGLCLGFDCIAAIDTPKYSEQHQVSSHWTVMN